MGIYYEHPDRKTTVGEAILALTLVTFVSSDDVELTRDEFLLAVANRIAADLRASGYLGVDETV